VLAQLRKDFPKDLRFVYRQFPLITIHDKAALASQAAEVTGEQGKFWEMHALLFEKQSEWAGMTVDEFKAWLTTNSGEMGLDAKKFADDLVSQTIVDKVMQAYQGAAAIGISGTPTLFINGQFYASGMDYDSLAAAVKQNSQIKQFSQCPPMTVDPNKKYTATLETEKGKIVVELYAKDAPVTVNSFVFLARQGWYDGVTFHRVIPGFVAQTGDPYGTGMGNPGYVFKNEIIPGLTFGEPGVIGMARGQAPDTNGSQFFITLTGITKDIASQLDGQYTIFGKVISGMDIVEKLTPRDPSQSPNLPPGDKILKVTIEEK
jgi:cyclophilin family peptidyl-prolyl cis-trans isomerase